MSWQLASLAVLALVLLGGFAWYERRRPPARVVALVAALAALAVVGRLAFAAIPNVKPTTDIVLFAGYALGAVPGFAVGAVTALVSNIFLGQGPWTAWQMAAWGGVGIAGAGLARAARGRELGRIPLAIACGLAGLAFGMVLDVYQWTLATRQDLPTYLAVAGSSFPYNLAHAIGNVAFCLMIGPAFVRALRRYRRRFEVDWAPARSAAAPAALAALAGLAVTVALTVAPAERARAADPSAAAPSARAAAAASPSTGALRYLRRAQNRNGGLGGARGQRSSQLFTGWAALGFAAARRNPRDVARPGGRSLTTYLRRGGSIRDTGELERTILVMKASGLSPRRFRGRDLVAELLRRQRGNGSWRANVTWTAFGILALRAAGYHPTRFDPIQRAANALERAQNRDGGFGFVASAQSDVDDTGAVLQALAAAGRRSGPAARKAVAYLRELANADGGYGQMQGRSSNAQSTSWAVQGLLAARAGLATRGRSPIRYLVGLQRSDGRISYSRTSNQTPVWVTAQALTALRRKTFPLATVPRKRRARRSGATARGARSGARARVARRRSRERSERAGGDEAPASDSRRGFGDYEPRDVSVRRTAVEERSSGGPSPLLYASVALLAAALVLLLRRRLRHRTGLG